MTVGRQRSFDKELALETAMHDFWQNGYTNTSLVDLTQVMGINKPSLYAAFGNKEQLFISALEQYAQQYVLPTFDLLLTPNLPLEQRLRAYLKSVARLFCQPGLPTGCLIVSSTCEFAGVGMPQTAHQFISNFNEIAKQKLIDFFSMEQTEGNLKSKSPPLALALYLMSINGGIAVLIRDGIPLAELDTMIEHVVQTMY